MFNFRKLYSFYKENFRTSKSYLKKEKIVKKGQWESLEEIKKKQWKKVKRLLEHALENVPYYKRVFEKENIFIEDLKNFEDFAQIPILKREDIQENLGQLKAANFKKEDYIENHTGGSTGIPLTFYQDKNYLDWARVSRHWGFALCGYKPGDKQVFIWGSDADSAGHSLWRVRLKDFLANEFWINAFDISEKELLKAAKKLVKWKPDFIWGYTSSLGMLADLVKAYNIKGMSPKAIQVTAGTLYLPLRKKIEQTFGCRVFDRYGSREVALIAHECEAHEGLHVLSDHNLVEIVRNGKVVGPLTEGKIIVTNLNNFAMPFIRYEIGDIGVGSDKKCSCGRGYPLLKKVIGRSVDIITSPSGKLLDGEFFTHLFYKIKGLKKFQVVQENLNDLTVKVVPGEEFERQKARDFLTKTIKEHGDKNFNLKFEFPDHIKPTASGKYVFTVSKVPLKFGGN